MRQDKDKKKLRAAGVKDDVKMSSKKTYFSSFNKLHNEEKTSPIPILQEEEQ